MKPLLILTLGAALAAGACGQTPAGTTGASQNSGNGAAAGTSAQPGAGNGGAAGASTQPAATGTATPAGPAYREVTIPAGTTLPLALTRSLASDTSAVEDAVTAELTRPIAIDGRDALPAGTRLSGVVTQVDGSGRVKGRAMIAFRFTSLRAGDDRYDVQTKPLSHVAPATKGEDATKVGIGAGAGAVIGGLLGGKEGAAKGAVVGGGAGTGVVLATKGQEVRLGPGADATTELTAPLTIRVPMN